MTEEEIEMPQATSHRGSKFFNEPVTYQVMMERRDLQLLRLYAVRLQKPVAVIVRDCLRPVIERAEAAIGNSIPQGPGLL